jgi:hypothetical protein
MARRLYGGRSGLQWYGLRLAGWTGRLPESVCWKDPGATFLSGYLMQRFDARVVCMVRHPCALLHSFRKRPWRPSFEDVLAQDGLLARYGKDVREMARHPDRDSLAFNIGIRWKLMARLITDLATRFPLLKVLRHEDLCAEPQDSAAEVCRHFGLVETGRMRSFVARSSTGTRTEPVPGRAHDFVRDSRGLADAWREHVSGDDERAILDIVGEDLRLFYPG